MFKAAPTADQPAVLALEDEIGFWGIQAGQFRDALNSVDALNLRVEINSIGGDVFAGLGIYNMLRSWQASGEGRTVTTRATPLAASIASVIMLAGDKREMPKNAFVMTHQGYTIAAGHADDLRASADALDKINDSIKGIYIGRLGASDEDATAMLSKVDNWLTADECLAAGFATELIEDVKATAKFDLKKAELPEQVMAIFKPKEKETKMTVAQGTPLGEQIVAKAKEAGLEKYGGLFALQCASLEDADTRIAQAREIQSFCAIAGRPDDASKAIKKNTPLVEVKAALVEAMANADVDIKATPAEKKPAESGTTATFSPTAIWKGIDDKKSTAKLK